MNTIETLKNRRDEIAAQLAPLAEAREAADRACIASNTTKTVEAAENAARAFDRVARMLSIVDADIKKAEDGERERAKEDKRKAFADACDRAIPSDAVVAFAKEHGPRIAEAHRYFRELEFEIERMARANLAARTEATAIGRELGMPVDHPNGAPALKYLDEDAIKLGVKAEIRSAAESAGMSGSLTFPTWCQEFNIVPKAV